jgi:phosphatidylserine decarboxylase
MTTDEITFFNRHTQSLEKEKVYGESALRWLYQSSTGAIALHAIVKRALFSQFYGWLMDSSRSVDMIAPFIEKYGLNPATFAKPLSQFTSFNDFFTRALAVGQRPLASSPVILPADGRHLVIPRISSGEHFFVKGQKFDLGSFLGDPALAERYADGTLVLSRLCPVDYHRFHFPCDGLPSAPRLIDGSLYSVSPIALRHRLDYLWRNKRVLTELETPQHGRVLIVEIGATNVGSIVQTYQPGHPVKKGDEKGYFRFGGSSTITLFEPGQITLAPDLLHHSAEQREVYAMMGSPMIA